MHEFFDTHALKTNPLPGKKVLISTLQISCVTLLSAPRSPKTKVGGRLGKQREFSMCLRDHPTLDMGGRGECSISWINTFFPRVVSVCDDTITSTTLTTTTATTVFGHGFVIYSDAS
jgi:hypothetical protein